MSQSICITPFLCVFWGLQEQASWGVIQQKVGGITGLKILIDDVFHGIGCERVVQKAYVFLAADKSRWTVHCIYSRLQVYKVLMIMLLFFYELQIVSTARNLLAHATICLISNPGSTSVKFMFKFVEKWCPPKTLYILCCHMVLKFLACSVAKSFWWLWLYYFIWDLTVPEKSYIYKVCCCLMLNPKVRQ